MQHGYSQYNFSKAGAWLANNVKEPGGRAFLVIYKDGKTIYSNAANDMTARKKSMAKLMANRQGKNADELLQDFTASGKERIASCGKWLIAALVMTFVDEGKLSLEDTIGKFLPVMCANGKGQIKI